MTLKEQKIVNKYLLTMIDKSKESKTRVISIDEVLIAWKTMRLSLEENGELENWPKSK
jgi:hypothetical protein